MNARARSGSVLDISRAIFSITGWSANSLFSISACLARMSCIIPLQFRFAQLPMKFAAQKKELRSKRSRRPISYAAGTLKLPA